MEVQAITFNRSTRANDRSDALIPQRPTTSPAPELGRRSRMTSPFATMMGQVEEGKKLKGDTRERGTNARSFEALQLSLALGVGGGQISSQLPRKTRLSRARCTSGIAV